MPKSKFNFKFNIKISWNYLIKGVMYAGVLMLGTLIGMLMRNDGAQGYSIWGVVSTINTITILIVFYFLKQDILKGKEQKKEPSKAEVPKDKTESKKEPEKFETPKDKKETSKEIVEEDNEESSEK